MNPTNNRVDPEQIKNRYLANPHLIIDDALASRLGISKSQQRRHNEQVKEHGPAGRVVRPRMPIDQQVIKGSENDEDNSAS